MFNIISNQEKYKLKSQRDTTKSLLKWLKCKKRKKEKFVNTKWHGEDARQLKLSNITGRDAKWESHYIRNFQIVFQN